MTLSVRAMLEAEFPWFQDDSGKLYAAELAGTGALTATEAEARAKADGARWSCTVGSAFAW